MIGTEPTPGRARQRRWGPAWRTTADILGPRQMPHVGCCPESFGVCQMPHDTDPQRNRREQRREEGSETRRVSTVPRSALMSDETMVRPEIPLCPRHLDAISPDVQTTVAAPVTDISVRVSRLLERRGKKSKKKSLPAAAAAVLRRRKKSRLRSAERGARNRMRC